jgi:dolichol-phosphate mannosyltransferase
MQLWPQVVAAKLRVTEIPVRLIYNDPKRHFGGMLDDPDNRLRHYLNVLCAEQKRIDASVLEKNDVPCPCGCD